MLGTGCSTGIVVSTRMDGKPRRRVRYWSVKDGQAVREPNRCM